MALIIVFFVQLKDGQDGEDGAQDAQEDGESVHALALLKLVLGSHWHPVQYFCRRNLQAGQKS